MRLYKLSPYLKGAAGMLVVLALYLCGAWTYARYQEFVVMRTVISQVLDAQAQRAKQTPAQTPKPTPSPEAPPKTK